MASRLIKRGLMTIVDMENGAMAEADGCFNKRIRGQWLEVSYDATSKQFVYRWGKNIVTRKVVANVLATA